MRHTVGVSFGSIGYFFGHTVFTKTARYFGAVVSAAVIRCWGRTESVASERRMSGFMATDGWKTTYKRCVVFETVINSTFLQSIRLKFNGISNQLKRLKSLVLLGCIWGQQVCGGGVLSLKEIWKRSQTQGLPYSCGKLKRRKVDLSLESKTLRIVYFGNKL